jgi:hypothetical protein
MKTLAIKHNLPRELIAHIYQFDNMKPEYNQVLNELLLKYNSGLWWLNTPPKYIFNKRELALADPWDEHLHYIDGAVFRTGGGFVQDKQLFTTYNDDNYTCITAILKAELLNELFDVYYDPYGDWWFHNMLNNIQSLEIFLQHRYNYMTWQSYLFDSKVAQKKYYFKKVLPFYTEFELTVRDHNAFLL